jgi:uncharacterized Zn finger protein
LKPPIIAEKDGRILAAHCTCMAGLGETCTHVAALLFAVDASVKLRDSKTVTDEKSYWLLPTSVKGVSYKEIREMDFTSAKTMKKKLDRKLDSAGDTPSSRSSQKQKTNIPDPTDDELASFFKALNETGSKPAIIALVPAYSEAYVHQPMQEDFPDVLTELKDDDAVELNYSELLKKCQKITIGRTSKSS